MQFSVDLDSAVSSAPSRVAMASDALPAFSSACGERDKRLISATPVISIPDYWLFMQDRKLCVLFKKTSIFTYASEF